MGKVEVARVAVCTTSGCWDRQSSGEIGTLRVLAGSGPTMPFCPFGSVGCCFISPVCRLQEECGPTWRMWIVRSNWRRKLFTWKKGNISEGSENKNPYGSRGHGLHARVHVFCVVIVSGTVIHFPTFRRNIPHWPSPKSFEVEGGTFFRNVRYLTLTQ